MRNPVPFGKYILLDRISVGGMAEVFKGKSFGVEGFEKVIAIKRILPSMGEDRDFIDMFIDEAKIAGSLAHANICQIFELGKIDGAHFIAMEYIWGKDLLQISNRLRKQRQVMDIPMACFILSKVCEGLDYAHRKRDPLGAPMNIVHRDCSPQNILISYEGEVKLIDFGIAKAASRSSKTVAGVLKGKFGYMSPEQVRGLALDRRSDIFAVGTVLYECITGERLFQCESDFSTLEKVRNVSIFPPSHFNRNIPPDLERVVMKALARNPEARYQYAGELQADLQQLLMKQEQVFTAKSLGSWVKQSFAAELARERKLMEGYKRIGPDGVSRQRNTPAPEVLDPSVPMGSLLGGQGRSRTATGEFDEGPTEVFGELTIDEDADDIAEVVAQVRARDSGPIQKRPQPMPAAGRRAPTNPPPVPEASRLISEEPTVAKVVVREKTPSPAFPIMAPPTGEMQLPPPGQELSFGPTSAVTPLPTLRSEPTRRRSSMVKDIGIGLGIAALVLVIFAGAKMLFFGDKPGTRAAEASAGTIAVTVPDNEPAEVHINGHRVGAVEGGEAFKSELEPDSYEVVVRRNGVPDCVRTVELTAKALEVVNCPFEKPEPKPSQLVLAGELDGAVVFVDGQQVSEQAAREPMELAAGIDHRILVQREGAPEYAFTVRLAPGQQTTRLVPSPEPIASRSKSRSSRRETKSAGGSVFLLAGNTLSRDQKKDRKTDADKKDDKKDRKKDDGKKDRKKDDAKKSAKKDTKKDTTGSDELVGDPEPKKADKGYLVAWTTPWARVFIDGKDTGKMTPIAPRAKIALKPGKHRVTFVVGKERFSYPVVIEAGETKKIREQLPVGASQ